MTTIHKTDTTKSPLLQPVIQRDYTAGMNFNAPAAGADPASAQPQPGGSNEKFQEPAAKQNFTPPPQPHEKPLPDDGTKAFAFDEINENPSDLGDGEQGPGLSMPAGSARTFSNTIGNLVQIYLPRATYGYCKIDIDNVRLNVGKGYLTFDWIDTFDKMNKSAEEALAIPDENIKMWKAALQHYLEYKQVAFANPETEFWVATAALLTDQGIRTYTLKKDLEKYMMDALDHCNPGMFEKNVTPKKEPEKTQEDEHKRAA